MQANKYMNITAPSPQMGAAPQMNHQQFMQANTMTFAQFGAKVAAKPVVKKTTLKEKVGKYWFPVAVAGVVGYKVYNEQNGAEKAMPQNGGKAAPKTK